MRLWEHSGTIRFRTSNQVKSPEWRWRKKQNDKISSCVIIFEMFSQLLCWMKSLNNVISHFNFVMCIQECEITSLLVLPPFFVNRKSGALCKYNLWVEVCRREWHVRGCRVGAQSQSSKAAQWRPLYQHSNEWLPGVMVKDHFFFSLGTISYGLFLILYIHIYVFYLWRK